VSNIQESHRCKFIRTKHLHACKKQKGKAEKYEVEKALSRAKEIY